MNQKPKCPYCLDHHWLIWREYPMGRKDLEPMPLFRSCQHCNPEGKLLPPIIDESQENPK